MQLGPMHSLKTYINLDLIARAVDWYQHLLIPRLTRCTALEVRVRSKTLTMQGSTALVTFIPGL